MLTEIYNRKSFIELNGMFFRLQSQKRRASDGSRITDAILERTGLFLEVTDDKEIIAAFKVRLGLA